MNVDESVAIDVHVHVEISPDGHISVITQLPAARRRTSRHAALTRPGSRYRTRIHHRPEEADGTPAPTPVRSTSRRPTPPRLDPVHLTQIG